ncbi:MAG: phosphate ABC transporter permease subunit PstC [Anaerolineales bacterium]
MLNQVKAIFSSRRSTWPKRLYGHGDPIWTLLLIFGSLLVPLLILAVGWMLWNQSAAARAEFGWNFLLPTLDANWDPIASNFQAWPFVYGTLLTSVVAIALAVPMSVGVAIFLAELCPSWLRLPLNWMIELLAAIPSVVYGLWGIFVFLPNIVAPVGSLMSKTLGQIPGLAPLFAGPMPHSGVSRLGAAFILAIMIMPTITAVTRDVLLSIPNSQREASLALGSTQWEAIWKVLLPYGLSGILGAILLGLGRALGETMAVTMVIGNSITGKPSLLSPGYTMASVIANEFAEAVSELHSQVLIEIGLVLFFLTLALNVAARLLVWSVARRTLQEVRS